MSAIGKVDVLYSAAVSGTKAEVSDKGQDVVAYHIYNAEAAVSYLQVFYALAAAVTVGTTVPDVSLPIPASGGATNQFSGKGWRVPTAMTVAFTTTPTGATTAAGFLALWRSQ